MSEITSTPLPAPRRGVPVWAQIIVWVALLGLLTVVAITLKRTQQGTVKVGDIIPDFSLTFFNNYQHQEKAEVKLSDLKGKVVVINFWASWCQPCEQEAPALEQAWQLYKPGGQVVFLGVDYVDTEPQALAFMKKFAVSYPNGPDLRTIISQMFHTTGVPETYILDRQGRLAYAKKGPFMSVVEITSVVDGLVK